VSIFYPAEYKALATWAFFISSKLVNTIIVKVTHLTYPS